LRRATPWWRWSSGVRGGETVPDAEAKRTLAALRAAEAKRDEPWAERADGARAALHDHHNTVGRYVIEVYDALLAEREVDSRAAAERVTRACEELIAAHREREQAAHHMNALISVIRRVRPGELPWSRAEPAVREAAKLLDQGGERAPVPRVDPRTPQAEQMVPPAPEPPFAFQ
jgi:hypothetical protein